MPVTGSGGVRKVLTALVQLLIGVALVGGMWIYSHRTHDAVCAGSVMGPNDICHTSSGDKSASDMRTNDSVIGYVFGYGFGGMLTLVGILGLIECATGRPVNLKELRARAAAKQAGGGPVPAGPGPEAPSVGAVPPPPVVPPPPPMPVASMPPVSGPPPPMAVGTPTWAPPAPPAPVPGPPPPATAPTPYLAPPSPGSTDPSTSKLRTTLGRGHQPPGPSDAGVPPAPGSFP